MNLPAPLQKSIVQPDPFSQECRPVKSQAPSRRGAICSDPSAPFQHSPALPCSLTPGARHGPTSVWPSTYAWCWGWPRSWRAAGSLHPAAGRCSVLGCFSGHSCPPALPWCPLPPRHTTKRSIVLHVNAGKSEHGPSPVCEHFHPGLRRVSQKNAAVSVRDHFCKAGEKIDSSPCFFLIYLFIA